MKLTIFTAAGGVGRQLLEQGVAAGHDVPAVARNPGKLTRQVRTVIVGLAAEPATQAAAAGPGAHSRPGRQGDPGRGEPGPGSRRRQADVGGVPVRPDLDGTQNVQIRSSSRVDTRRSSIDQIGGNRAPYLSQNPPADLRTDRENQLLNAGVV
jgi:hypothetical protein